MISLLARGSILAIAVVMLMLLTGTGVSSPSSATVAAKYTVSQDGFGPLEITPLDGGATSVEDFYSYANPCPASANTGLEIADTSQLFLYDGPLGLSLVTIHDSPEDCLGLVPATGGQVNFTYIGLPAGATKVVGDDPPEGNIPNASWNWLPCCTDGNAIRGGLDECNFDVTIEPDFLSGIDTWVARSGAAGGDIVTFPNLTDPVTISCHPACAESPISPALVNPLLFPGESEEVEKCVQVPDLPPKPDIMILFDTTGSMGDDIATVQAKLADLISAVNAGTTDPQFGVANYEDFPFSPWGLNSNVAYELLQSITGDTVAVTNAINALSTFPGSGADTPESGYEALYQTLTGAGRNLLDAGGAGPDGDFTDLGEIAPGQDAGFRADSSRVILLVGDAAFHDAGDAPASVQFPAGYPGASEADVLAAMGDTSLFCLIPDELEGVGPESQCDDLGGTNIPIGASSADIVEAIIQALGEVEVEVEMVSDCAWPISTTFAPASQTVAAGGVALFTETISVAADAPGGTYICTDRVLIDGDLLLDEAGNIATETKVVRVPEGFLTGGGQIVNGKGKTSSEQISFGGNVGFLEDGSLVGHWETNFQNVHDVKLTGSTSNFHSTEIVALQFANDGGAGPNPPPANANIGGFLATGRLGQQDGWSLLVCLADRGEPGKHDSIRLKLFTPGGVLLYDSLSDYASEDDTLGGVCEDRHKLDHGNFQIHSGLKDLP